jgi:hypothetical protein
MPALKTVSPIAQDAGLRESVARIVRDLGGGAMGGAGMSFMVPFA